MTDINTHLATPNDLNQAAREQAAVKINSLVADCFALFIKIKNFHWHMSGPHYRDYHLLLDEHADQVFAMIDVLAERVRKLGCITVHSVGEIAKLTRVKDNNEGFVAPITMMQILMKDNEDFLKQLRNTHETCSDAKDVASTSIIENFIDETERRVWFLFEIQTGFSS